jgi:DNA-binding PadR family transcriptional regulator
MSLAKLAILGGLMEKPMHGYELKQYFEHAPGVFWMINYGSIYPTLKKLESEGLVKGRAKVSNDTRGKIVYSITKSGREAFKNTLKERLKKDAFVRDEFTLHLFFMDFLDRKTIRQMIKSKLEGNARILDMVKEHEKIHKCELPRYRCEVLKRGKLHLETEISWLNDTLKDIEKEVK